MPIVVTGLKVGYSLSTFINEQFQNRHREQVKSFNTLSAAIQGARNEVC